MKRLLALLCLMAAPLGAGTVSTTGGLGSIISTLGTGSIVFMPAAAGGGGGAGNTDSFTDANGTALATHNANWVSMDATNVVTNCQIQSNAAQASANWVTCGAMYNTSSSDSSQMLFKANAENDGGGKKVCVRAGVNSGADKSGYCAHFSGLSAGNWTYITVEKASVYLGDTGAGSGSWAQASDHTIKAVASGTSPVSIVVTVDGGAALNSITDSTSPYGTGKPGMILKSNSTGAASNTVVDDWTDAP